MGLMKTMRESNWKLRVNKFLGPRLLKPERVMLCLMNFKTTKIKCKFNSVKEKRQLQALLWKMTKIHKLNRNQKRIVSVSIPKLKCKSYRWKISNIQSSFKNVKQLSDSLLEIWNLGWRLPSKPTKVNLENSHRIKSLKQWGSTKLQNPFSLYLIVPRI